MKNPLLVSVADLTVETLARLENVAVGLELSNLAKKKVLSNAKNLFSPC